MWVPAFAGMTGCVDAWMSGWAKHTRVSLRETRRAREGMLALTW
jgi:hypothetical protein